MKTTGWIAAVVGAAVWCSGWGVGVASEDKPAKTHTRTHDDAQAADHETSHAKREHKSEHHKININEASKSDLMTLDGINAGLAQSIIAYREAHGPFKRAHDLEKVAGVSKDMLEKNAGRITVK